jgi:hypothetical protein
MHGLPAINERGLRRFGLLTAVALTALFGLALPWAFGRSFPVWPWVVALPLVILALARPAALRPVYRVWMRMAAVLGIINTSVILALVFYALVTPLGLLLRWLGRDPMRRQFDATESYRITSRLPSGDHMERPF